MEFPDAGAQCDRADCRQLGIRTLLTTQEDFLPYTCPRCSNTYCHEHRMPEEHSCTGVVESDFVTCPICNQKLRVMPGEVPGDKLSIHIDRGCENEVEEKVKKLKKETRCQYGRCKTSELIPIVCKRCNKNFCIKHRNERDHMCGKEMHQQPVDLQGVKTTIKKTERDRAREDQQRQIEEARRRREQQYMNEKTVQKSHSSSQPRPPGDEACCVLM